MSLRFIDAHIHMQARTTDDYEAMAQAGIVAVLEPAFWVGQPRTSVGAFQHYFASLVGWERFRASQFGVRHYCMIGLNAKEANNLGLAEEVLRELVPRYVCKEGVVAVGEIGFDDITPAEEKVFRAQLELAKEAALPVCVHTPHRNKKHGTLRSMDIAVEHGLEPSRVVIDHNNEETVEECLRRGFWTAFTIYPRTKMGNERMVAIAQRYGSERILIDSSADWGVSDPLAVPKTAALMLKSGIPEKQVHEICYENALLAYGQSGQISAEHWTRPAAIDQRTLFEGNSVLRGQEPRIDAQTPEQRRANLVIE
jgi:predicted metal-dependent TIM-barrel fold hydrolase